MVFPEGVEPGVADTKQSSNSKTANSDRVPTAPRTTTGETDRPSATRFDSESLKAALATDRWYRLPNRENRPAWQRGEPTWQHPELAKWFADGDVTADVWQPYLQDNDRIVRANATIAMARSGTLQDAGLLANVIRQTELRLEQRLAAAEALSYMPADRRIAEVEQLLEQFGSPKKHSKQYIAELHAELLRGLAHADLALSDSRLLRAMRSKSATVRVAALQVWAAVAEKRRSQVVTLPEQIISARQDHDPRVRRAALEALAAASTTGAHEQIAASLNDHDLTVRRTAIVALGKVAKSGDNVRTLARLNKILKDGPELDRIAAVEALAQAEQWDALLRATDDRAWRVRRALAMALRQSGIAEHPPATASEALARLVSDTSSQVQAAAVETLAGWPIEMAGPILIEALERSGYHARKRAAELLAEKWPPARNVKLDAQGHLSTEQIARLRSDWQARVGPLEVHSDPNQKIGTAVDRATLDALQTLLEQIARGEARDAHVKLKQVAPNTLETLEQLVERRNVQLPRTVLRELKTTDPAFGLIARLEDETPRERRHTIRELTRLAEDRPLRALARHWLALVLSEEDDTLVWQQAWPLLIEDTSHLVEALAFRCLVHRSPQVRQLACQYFARHPKREAVASLLTVLHDEQPSVVVAAIGALSQKGLLDDPTPLVQLLDHSSPEVRLKAAQALAKLDIAEGIHALERAAYDPDARVRTAAARMIGGLGHPRLAGILVGMLDDSRLSVRRAALTALQDLAERDVGRPNRDRSPRLSDEVRRWKKWWASQQVVEPASREARRDAVPHVSSQ